MLAGCSQRPARRAARNSGRHRIAAIGAGTCLAVVAAACSATGKAGGRPATAAPSDRTATAAPSDRPATAPAPGRQQVQALQVTPAPYQLPAGISREVVLARGPDLLLAGGLTSSATSTDAVTLLDPVTGRTARAGRLAAATHDAAGATLGQPMVFGGGARVSGAAVQALGPSGRTTVTGQLPVPRSDLSAVTVAGTAYLLGGYDGAAYDAAVLATSDGRRFRTVATLPVPVRYAAVTALGRQIWIFGGQTPAGLTTAVQRVSLASGRAAVAGHLPQPMTGGSAFTLGGRVYVAGGQVAPSARVAAAALVTSNAVLSYDPRRGTFSPAGRLPVPVANAGLAVLDGTAFLVGGNNGQRAVPSVTELRLVAAGSALPPAGAAAAAAGPGGPGPILTGAPWLAPVRGRGHLAPRSDPSVLPGDILIADDWNNRLLIVDPRGRVRWRFPRPGDLARGQSFQLPDDAFFSPDGKDIIATEEEYSVVSVIGIATHKIVYRYGTPGVPGSTANHAANPDDAMLLPGGMLLSADIENCRILLIRPPAHRPRRIIGTTGSCGHNPPRTFGSPNGAFPATNGKYLVTEINGDWANQISLGGHISWSTHPPGVAYPSDTNEVYPGRYLTADYSAAGQVVEFNSHGRLLWRFGGLNHPSLALPLPNGDILVNDDYNDRVIVIDPATSRIVWQYGHTGVPGTAPGYLNDPDGVDVTPPDSMLIAHAASMGRP